ncbi:MAG: ABC transporter permease subunit [Dehalococcoidales bacterium]|nr:ABC transporter permease subunit [Dehalococcoidales bacterium]
MKLLTILNKELREIVKNKLLLFTVGLPPIIFALLPIIMLSAAQSDPLSPAELEPILAAEPALRQLDPVTATQIIFMNQVILMFLIVPAMVPLAIASFSIIGEKQARSLEPLLATPITVWELLLGKSLAAVLPAIAATWAGYAIALLGVYFVGTSLAFLVATSTTWLLSMLLLAPLLGVAAVGLAVIVSSRVNDTRVAQQASLVMILPLIGLFVAQIAGGALISVQMILLTTLGLLAADAALLYAAVRLFRREAILTEWR